jgi:pimeloyl-ACP methyl ester carboxylesterase
MSIGYVQVGDGNLYYEIDGAVEGRPTLVLSHAAFLDSDMWNDQWKAFVADYRVIRYDMLGYGRSDRANGPRCRRADLYQLLRHLNVSQAHLLGCSMGGEILLDLALEHPELAASLTIVNGVPSGFVPQGEPPAYLFEMIGATQHGNIDLASELQLRIWFDGPQRRSDQVDAATRQRASAMNRIFIANGTWAIADMQSLHPLTPSAIQRLHEIQVPTFIISGALDHSENRRASRIMEEQIPGAQSLSIPNTAHVPNLEQPTIFNQAVLAFLATI